MNSWIISDTHFGHANAVNKFKRADGSPLRDFTSVDHMDTVMRNNWFSRVKANDIIYHLGDVVMNKNQLYKVADLPGRKILIAGNHDTAHITLLADIFEKIVPLHEIKIKGVKCIMTHVPIHTSQLEYRWKYNLHGHMHDSVITDPRYINMCVEHWNYAPTAIRDIERKING